MLKRTESSPRSLTLETQDDYVVSLVLEFEAAIAETPPDEETTLVIALTMHSKGKEQLASTALEHLEKCIQRFPERPSDATNQVRLCLLSTGYLFVADHIGRDTIAFEDDALRYLRYAADNDFWDYPLLLCVASLLSEQWVFGQRAKKIVETKIDEWIIGGHYRAIVQAAVALRGQLSPKHEIALKDACEHLSSIEDLSWFLIALKKSGDRFYESQKTVAQTILDRLTSDFLIQSVLRSGSLAYFLSHHRLINGWRESGLIDKLCRETIIRDAYLEGGKLICELSEDAWKPRQLPLVPSEITLATYAIVYAGFDAIRGVRLKEAPALLDAIRQASGIKAGYSLVSPLRRHLENLFVTLSLAWVSLLVFQIDQDVNSRVLSFLIFGIKALLGFVAPVAAALGWAVRGDALGGLWNLILEQTGQKE